MYGINLLWDHLFKNLFGKDTKQHHEFHKVEIIALLFVAFGIFLILCSPSQSSRYMAFGSGFAINMHGFVVSKYMVKKFVMFPFAVLTFAPHDLF